ncbi:MAG: hypothetical protein AAFV37_00495 [Pseudomonadota bacterium]
MDKQLSELVEELRDYKMDEDQRRNQRISFVYGNSKLDDNTTKEQAEEAVRSDSIPRVVA